MTKKATTEISISNSIILSVVYLFHVLEVICTGLEIIISQFIIPTYINKSDFQGRSGVVVEQQKHVDRNSTSQPYLHAQHEAAYKRSQQWDQIQSC